MKAESLAAVGTDAEVASIADHGYLPTLRVSEPVDALAQTSGGRGVLAPETGGSLDIQSTADAKSLVSGIFAGR